jgi:hypothetical protein
VKVVVASMPVEVELSVLEDECVAVVSVMVVRVTVDVSVVVVTLVVEVSDASVVIVNVVLVIMVLTTLVIVVDVAARLAAVARLAAPRAGTVASVVATLMDSCTIVVLNSTTANCATLLVALVRMLVALVEAIILPAKSLDWPLLTKEEMKVILALVKLFVMFLLSPFVMLRRVVLVVVVILLSSEPLLLVLMALITLVVLLEVFVNLCVIALPVAAALAKALLGIAWAA